METVISILGILLGAETIGFISFFVYLKLNKREKTAQVVQSETNTQMQELDLIQRYKSMVFDLQEERERYWTENKNDMTWIKSTLEAIVKYLDGPFQQWMLKANQEITQEINTEK